MMVRYACPIAVSLIAIVQTLTTSAHAQDAAPQLIERGQVDDIVVTALRREQSLQDVPIAVTAITADKLALAQVETVRDYAVLVPSFKAADSGGVGGRDITIRGVGNLGGSTTSIAVYVNEFGVSGGGANIGNDLSLVDVERIEVLRGPQGTLFGRNTIGGAVNIVLKSPVDRFEFASDLEIASYQSVLARATVNVPLVSGIAAVRGTIMYRYSDGFIRDIGPAGNTNDFRDLSGRLALRLTPTDRFTADFTVIMGDLTRGVADRVPTGVIDPIVSGVGFSPIDSGEGFFPENRRQIANDKATRSTRNFTTAVSRLSYEFDGAVAILNAGLQDTKVRTVADFDNTSLNAVTGERDAFDNRLYSIEARLQSDNSTGFRWLAGAVYSQDKTLNEDLTQFQEDFFIELGLPGSLAPFDVTNVSERSRVRTLAAFGELAWTSADKRFDISLSGRYTRDKLRGSFRDTSQTFTDFLPLDIAVVKTASFEAFTPKLTLAYQANDQINAYASVSKGYKAGGFNFGADGIPGSPVTYDPETAWNYEVGLKSDLLDRRLRINVALFQMRWKDIQVVTPYVSPSLQQFSFTQNGASARSSGVELEVTARPFNGLTLDFAGSFNDATFRNFPNAIGTVGEVVDASGNRLPGSSRWQATVAGQYDLALATDLDAHVRAEYIYQSNFYDDVANQRAIGTYIDKIAYLNLRAGLKWKTLKATAFAENLGGDKRAVGWVRSTFLSGYQATIRPERYGVRFSYAY